jgi:hypothetical protein
MKVAGTDDGRFSLKDWLHGVQAIVTILAGLVAIIDKIAGLGPFLAAAIVVVVLGVIADMGVIRWLAQRKTSRLWRPLGLVVSAVLLLLMLFSLWNWTQKRPSKVPDLYGRHQDIAIAITKDAGFNWCVDSTRNDTIPSEFQERVVYQQWPHANSLLARGSEVKMWVYTGKTRVRIVSPNDGEARTRFSDRIVGVCNEPSLSDHLWVEAYSSLDHSFCVVGQAHRVRDSIWEAPPLSGRVPAMDRVDSVTIYAVVADQAVEDSLARLCARGTRVEHFPGGDERHRVVVVSGHTPP